MGGKYFSIPTIKGYKRNEIIAMFKERIRTNRGWAKATLKHIGDQQTAVELHKNVSNELNSYGFTQSDAPILTRYYKKYMSKENIDDATWYKLGAMLSKYAKQVASMLPAETLAKLLIDYYENFKK